MKTTKIKLDKTCGTCEFNFRGICGGYKYNEEIKDLNNTCEGWESDYKYFSYLINNAPWYIKDKYMRYKISFGELVNLIEKDAHNEPIVLNIFDLIEKVYGLCFPYDFAEVLDVSEGVLRYAYVHGTPQKRLYHFSTILKIPTHFFDKVTTLDIPTIEQCKKDFFEFIEESLDDIKQASEERYTRNLKNEIAQSYSANKIEFDKKLKIYSEKIKLCHDMSDDYKSRDYVIAIKLQKDSYIGTIFYDYNFGGYGLTPFIMNDILEFINALDAETINEYNDECFLINDINLRADNNCKEIHFSLHDPNGDPLNITTTANKLCNYIVGYEMIRCNGHGKKKERRKCIECKNFTPNVENAKGYCSIRKEYVQRSRIICGFDFAAKEK